MQRAEQNAFANKWLVWIGPGQYQAFAGQLQDYDAVPDAKLIDLRVTAQPLPYLELGASRAMQWGGGDRSESLSTLWNAIKGNDNFDNSDDDKSNQIAGFDVRLKLQPLLQVPAQYVGEDEAGGLPAKKCIWLESIIHQVITICLSNCIQNGQTLVPMARYRAFPIIIV